jgi:S1/P1 nuclease
MHNARARAALVLVLALVPTPPLRAWNGTGHQIVARIAWDTMTPTVRERVLALLQAAPSDACLAQLMPTDSRPLAARRREFFLRASTWADTLRPGDDGERACTRFHRSEWHYINFFWEGVSGATGVDRPADRRDMRPAPANVVARLPLLRALATCVAPRCGTTTPERAIALAWILHLVGDIHQPLHTSARVTARPDERQGDQGGNLFILDSGPPILRLHGYWDGIVDRSAPRGANESNAAYIGRLAALFMQRHPASASVAELAPGQYEAWALEGFETTKVSVYPVTLKRGAMPGEQYRRTAFTIAQRAIAQAGYRLANLLNAMFG